MIKTKKLVPEVYYNRSRDFQLLGRIYDIVFNYLKTNSEIIESMPYSEDIDDKLVPLISTTLGFKQTHEYNTEQLKVLCSSFSYILRNKGNITAIDTLLKVIANVENTTEPYFYTIDAENPYLLKIYLPINISDTSLLEDILYYILPAGMTYRIIKELVIQNKTMLTKMGVSNERATLKVTGNYNMLASQVPQDGMNPYIVDSSGHGLGRIEDMHIIQVKDNTQDNENIEKVVTLSERPDQTDSEDAHADDELYVVSEEVEEEEEPGE